VQAASAIPAHKVTTVTCESGRQPDIVATRGFPIMPYPFGLFFFIISFAAGLYWMYRTGRLADMKAKPSKGPIVIVMVGALATWLMISWQESVDGKDIKAWAQEHNLTVQLIDHRYMNCGPYNTRNSRRKSSIYRIETDKGTYWLKYSPNRASVYLEEKGGYTRLE
jgi:hypothetical protein